MIWSYCNGADKTERQRAQGPPELISLDEQSAHNTDCFESVCKYRCHSVHSLAPEISDSTRDVILVILPTCKCYKYSAYYEIGHYNYCIRLQRAAGLSTDWIVIPASSSTVTPKEKERKLKEVKLTMYVKLMMHVTLGSSLLLHWSAVRVA